MTREEIIEQLENMILLIRQNGKDWLDERDIPILEEVIKAMKMEPCEDTISRQAVLNEIETVCFSKAWSKFRADNGSNGTRDYIINYIEQLPPVQPEIKCIAKITMTDEQVKEAFEKAKCEILAAHPEQKWIPVSERLPEEGQKQLVLFCDIDEDIMIGYHVDGRPDTHFTDYWTGEDVKNVRAWMPLPEPYKVESEE